MRNPASAIRSAIWHTHMGDPDGCAMARTNSMPRTNVRTHVTKTQDHHLLFLNARVGLWITRISRQGVTA